MASNRTLTEKILQIAVHVGSLAPLALLVIDGLNNNLTFNPIQEATLRTGKSALVLLVLSLACTPLYTLTKYPPFTRARKPLGLYAFMYVSIHFLIFVALDYGLSWTLIQEAIFEKRYALVGFAAFLILLPLAITSTKGMQRRLKKRWKALHRWVYLAGILAVIHYVWLVKSDIREPLIYGAVLAVLLLLRVPPIKKRVGGIFRFKAFTRRRKTRESASRNMHANIAGQ